jgi:putative flippase GtrA
LLPKKWLPDKKHGPQTCHPSYFWAVKTAIAKSSWFRSQAVAITATSVDFLVTISLKEFAGLLLAVSNGTGAFCGALTSFLLLRHWAFKRHDQRWHGQAVRYALASGLSILLNTGGVVLLAKVFGIQYVVAKTLVAILMGLTVNYLMFKYFVFR